MAEDDHIDKLLARYLRLLDTYTTLRTELTELQSSVYHSLARANFTAERGMRYGCDFYDERVQATKLLTTEQSEDGLPKFELVDLDAKPACEIEEKEPEAIAKTLEQTTLTSESMSDHSKVPEGEHGPESKATRPPKSKDPLRWFGILSPPSLKEAQSSASELVGTAVKLSNVSAEMMDVEIEIRRARKRKVKMMGSGGKAVHKDAKRGIVVVGVNPEVDAKPLTVTRDGKCGRAAV